VRLRADDRGVTVQIGTVLLFAVLIVLVSTYQATVVPQQNEQVEYNHNQRVHGQLQDLRDELHRTAATGTPGTATVSLGTRYPERALFVNPAPPSGRLATTGRANVTIENATASGETGDYWNGAARNFSTRGLTYEPRYSVYQDPPTTVYRNGVLYNRFADANVTLAGQQLISGNRISLVALNGSLSESTNGAASVNVQPVSAPTRTVSVQNETANVSIAVPTSLSEERAVGLWRKLLADEMNESRGDDRYVLAVEAGPDEDGNDVRIVLEPGVYELQMAKVGVGSDVTDSEAHYITDVRGDNATVSPGGKREIVVEVRDRYNNPVSGATVTANESSSQVTPEQAETGPDGRAVFVYEAPENASDETTVSFDIDGGSSARERANVTLYVDEGGTTADRTYDVRWVGAVGPKIDNCTFSLPQCNVTTDVQTDIRLTANVSADNRPVAGATVDYAVNDTTNASTTPGSEVTDALGRSATNVTLAAVNDTVTVFAASGDDVDAIDIRVKKPGGDDDESDADATPPTLEQFMIDDRSDCPSGQTPCPGDSGAVEYGVDWEVSDSGGSGLSTVVISLVGPDGQVASTEEPEVTGSSASGTVTLTPDQGSGEYGGDYTVEIEAVDGAGNTVTGIVSDTADGQGGGGAGVDPGFAYEDTNGDGRYDEGTDTSVSESQLDGSYAAAGGNDLVVPDSTDGSGSLDLTTVDWSGDSVSVGANVTSRGEVTVEARDGSISVADRTINNYDGGSGSGGVTLTSNESVNVGNASVQTKGDVTISGGSSDLTGASIDNYVGGSGSGGVSITTDEDVIAASATVNTKGDINVDAGSLVAPDATFNNYQGGSGSGGITVSVTDTFGAGSSAFQTKGDVQLSGTSVDLDGTEINNYQGGSGSGAIGLTASGGALSITDGRLRSKADVTLSGNSLDARSADIDNYAGGSGSGAIEFGATAGDAVLNETVLNAGDEAIAAVEGGTLYVDRAVIEVRGGAGVLENAESAPIVGDPERGTVT